MPFQPGVSGNPSGRSKSTRTKKRDKHSDQIMRWVPGLLRETRRLALAGDMVAMALLLDRALPKLRPVSKAYEAPLNPEATTDANRKAVIGALAAGDMPIDDGTALLGALKADQSPAAAFGITIVLDGSKPNAALPMADIVEVAPSVAPRLAAERVPANQENNR